MNRKKRKNFFNNEKKMLVIIKTRDDGMSICQNKKKI